MALTPEDKQEIVNAIKAESKDISMLPEVATLDNVKSLPAMQGPDLVSVPLPLLAKVRTAADLADGVVTREKLAEKSVTASRLADRSVTTDKIERGAVTPEKVADGLLDHIIDIGTFGSKDAACAYAARSEIAGNKKAALIVFTATGATGAQLEGRIFQMVNGEDVSMQYLLWDKRLYRRNVTGATGVEGGATNAFPFEETGVHKLAYNASGRTLSLQSYQNGAISQIELPLAYSAQAGMMSQACYASVSKLSTNALGEKTPGAESVTIQMPFATSVGGTTMRTFTLGKATTARAGLMTAADRERLDALGSVPAVTPVPYADALLALEDGASADKLREALGGSDYGFTQVCDAIQTGGQLVAVTDGRARYIYGAYSGEAATMRLTAFEQRIDGLYAESVSVDYSSGGTVRRTSTKIV